MYCMSWPRSRPWRGASTPGGKRGAQFSPDGKDVYYLHQVRVEIANVESHQSKPLAITAEMDVDFCEKMEVFHDEAWSYLGDNYFNPKMNDSTGRPSVRNMNRTWQDRIRLTRCVA